MYSSYDYESSKRLLGLIFSNAFAEKFCSSFENCISPKPSHCRPYFNACGEVSAKRESDGAADGSADGAADGAARAADGPAAAAHGPDWRGTP